MTANTWWAFVKWFEDYREEAKTMKVQVGDIWRDNDVRNSYEDHVRTIKITRVEGQYAYGVCEQSGRPTRIRLDRFDPKSSTGYTRVFKEESRSGNVSGIC